MDNYGSERRKQHRLEKLGTNRPICGVCGEADDRCIEKHHPGGRKRDEAIVLLCANCHRKLADDQKNHPNSKNVTDPLLDRIGHFLLGLADMLALVIERLRKFGTDLIALAKSPLVAEEA